jgi:hypothetical protein
MEHELSLEEIQEKEALKRLIQSYFREGPDYDFYLIPAETELFSGYRGKLDDYNFETAISQPKFFGFNKKTAEVYGYAFAYRTTQDYELIAMDSLKTLNYLYKNADEEIRNVLRRNFGYNETKIKDAQQRGKSFVPIRTSTKSTDFKLVQYLCSKEFSGYATNFMVEDFEGTFHPECAICTPIDVELNPDYHYNDMNGLAIPGLATPDSYAIREKVQELIIKDTQLKNTEAHTDKKRKSVFGFSQMGPPRMSSSLFGLDSPPRMSSSLFGPDSPPRMSSSLFGLDSPPRTPDGPIKSRKTGGRKQKRNASKKGIKSLRNKSYNNVRRRKVSNRRN